MINKRPIIIDLYTFDRKLSAKLQEDGFLMHEDNSAPKEDPLYGFFKIPVEFLPDYIKQYRYELRDSYDGAFIDPETMEYAEFEDLEKIVR